MLDLSPFLPGVETVEWSWLTLALASSLVHLNELGLDRSGSSWLMYHRPLGLLTSRCLETPGDHNPDTITTPEKMTYYITSL
jgi:hypothetical protein